MNNKSCDDLELRKMYEILPDDCADSEGLLRVIDEFGEDYLYPESCFLAIELPPPVKRGTRIALVSGLSVTFAFIS